MNPALQEPGCNILANFAWGKHCVVARILAERFGRCNQAFNGRQ